MPQSTHHVPIGTIVASVLDHESLPSGWLPCDGSTIPAEYSELITALGSNVTPNLIGRTLLGAGNLGAASTSQTDGLDPAFSVLGTALQIGSTGGESQHRLNIAEMPTHWHTIYDGNFGVHGRSFVGNSDGDWPFETNPTTMLKGTDPAGNSGAHYNVQPYFSVTYMICAGRE